MFNPHDTPKTRKPQGVYPQYTPGPWAVTQFDLCDALQQIHSYASDAPDAGVALDLIAQTAERLLRKLDGKGVV